MTVPAAEIEHIQPEADDGGWPGGLPSCGLIDVGGHFDLTINPRRRLTALPPGRGALAIFILLSFVTACSKTRPPSAVALASCSLSAAQVTLGGPFELTCQFDVAPNAKITEDHQVLVHFVDPDGNVIWTDDHDPPVATSAWKPGQTIGPYTRPEFVPPDARVGATVVLVALARGTDRLPLAGIEPADRKSSRREYKVASLRLLPAADDVSVRFLDGWYQPEAAPDNARRTWRWMQRQGIVEIRNPRRDALLYLDFDGQPDVFGASPQVVRVLSGDRLITSFTVTTTAPMLRQIPIAAAQLGTGDTAEIRLEADKTFVPANLGQGASDRRELAIRVYHVFVKPM